MKIIYWMLLIVISSKSANCSYMEKRNQPQGRNTELNVDFVDLFLEILIILNRS